MSLSNKQPNSTKQTQCTYQVHTGRMHEQIVFTKQIRQFKVRSTRVCVSIHLWWREEGKYSDSLRQDLRINYLLHPNWIFGSTVRRESIRIFRVQVAHCCSTKLIRKPDSPSTKTLSQLPRMGSSDRPSRPVNTGLTRLILTINQLSNQLANCNLLRMGSSDQPSRLVNTKLTRLILMIKPTEPKVSQCHTHDLSQYLQPRLWP